MSSGRFSFWRSAARPDDSVLNDPLLTRNSSDQKQDAITAEINELTRNSEAPRGLSRRLRGIREQLDRGLSQASIIQRARRYRETLSTFNVCTALITTTIGAFAWYLLSKYYSDKKKWFEREILLFHNDKVRWAKSYSDEKCHIPYPDKEPKSSAFLEMLYACDFNTGAPYSSIKDLISTMTDLCRKYLDIFCMADLREIRMRERYNNSSTGIFTLALILTAITAGSLFGCLYLYYTRRARLNADAQVNNALDANMQDFRNLLINHHSIRQIKAPDQEDGDQTEQKEVSQLLDFKLLTLDDWLKLYSSGIQVLDQYDLEEQYDRYLQSVTGVDGVMRVILDYLDLSEVLASDQRNQTAYHSVIHSLFYKRIAEQQQPVPRSLLSEFDDSVRAKMGSS